MNFRELYIDYVYETNAKGSNKAGSYVKALDYLGPILLRKAPVELRVGNVWVVNSFQQIERLYEFVLEQQKLKDNGMFGGESPPSYWDKGWYSAALKSFSQFLVIHQYENRLWDIYKSPKLSPEELSKQLAKQDIESAELLIDEKGFDFKSREGRDAVREVKTRIGQGFFRKMILKQYGTQCCITGLSIPEVLRASHITSWAADPANRMNPCNGLCLSATYDAAFDKHLISFDDDYRMILSPVLKEYYTNKAFKEYFLSREGEGLLMPQQYCPDLGLLEKHRQQIPS